ncbi:MAG: DUF2079 domain-containing protein [Thermoanaerobaculales bacterium]|nr:DUF2079 domain-containing protein [Thermoanaerobaculales bacterium]
MTGKSSSPTPKERGNWARLWLWIAAVTYFAAVVILNALQIKALAFTKGIDQTYLFESLSNTVHGRFFVHTHAITNLGGWGLMDHFWPSMLLLVPFVAVFENILSLYVINALCLTVTGLVLSRIARHTINSETIALLAALVFWTMPEAYAFAVTGNWPEIWAMPFFALLFLFYFEDRPLAFAFTAIPFMGCMEQMLVYVAIFAGIEIFSQRRRRWLILPIALAVLWFAIIVVFTQDTSTGRFFTHAFAIDGPHIVDFLKRLFFDLDRSPLLYLSLLWPPSLTFALPPSVIVTAWGIDFTLIPRNHGALRYAFFIFFVMAIGGIRGLGVVARFLEPRVKRPAARIATVLLCLTLIVHALTFTRMWPRERAQFVPEGKDRLVWKVLETLPGDTRIVANREISYAFLGSIDAFVGFFNRPFFSLQEFYFDRRNQPVPPWTGVEKFHAMGRHTPSAIVLENLNNGFRPAAALWAVRDSPYRHVRCADATGDGRMDVLLAPPSGRTQIFVADSTQPLVFADPVFIDTNVAFKIPTQTPYLPPLEVDAGMGQDIRISADHQRLIVTPRNSHKNPIQHIAVNGYLEEIVATDIDGNKTIDILAIDSQRYLIRVFSRGVNGTWAERKAIPAPPIPTSIAVADLDADGDQDIVVTKSQRPQDVHAFARLVDHEQIDHIFWFDNPLQDALRRHFGQLGWSIEDAGNLLYLSRPTTQDIPVL